MQNFVCALMALVLNTSPTKIHIILLKQPQIMQYHCWLARNWWLRTQHSMGLWCKRICWYIYAKFHQESIEEIKSYTTTKTSSCTVQVDSPYLWTVNTKEGQKHIQSITGNVLFFGHAIDTSIQLAINNIVSMQAHPIEQTNEKVKHC